MTIEDYDDKQLERLEKELNRRQYKLAKSKSYEISRDIVFSGDFIDLLLINWKDSKDNNRTWDCASRKNNTEAVSMAVWLKPSDRLVFIKQYRPPTQSYALEFPAGLIDSGENVSEAAIRELKEETGYIGDIVQISPTAYSSSGFSDEKVTLCVLEVDERLSANQKPIQELDSGEDIEVFLVERSDISDFISKEQLKGTVMTSRMIAYLLGQELLIPNKG